VISAVSDTPTSVGLEPAIFRSTEGLARCVEARFEVDLGGLKGFAGHVEVPECGGVLEPSRVAF
jgi:hypothetical protein